MNSGNVCIVFMKADEFSCEDHVAKTVYTCNICNKDDALHYSRLKFNHFPSSHSFYEDVFINHLLQKN